MKVALITPVPLLRQYADLTGDHYHLTLSHLVIKYPEYASFYQSMAEQGHTVMLDNSAYEFGKADDTEVLVKAIELSSPTEVVLPDVKFMGVETYEGSRKFVEVIRKRFPRREFGFFLCPQGRTLMEFLECLVDLVELAQSEGEPHATIGIPRHYEGWLGGLPRLAALVQSLFVDHPIHMLGLGRDWDDLEMLGRLNLRGVDSAKPFFYAAAKKYLHVEKYQTIRRPANYFDMTEVSDVYLYKNVRTFKTWADGKPVLSSQRV